MRATLPEAGPQAAVPRSWRAEWNARLDLGFTRGPRGTVLSRRLHEGPLRVQKALHPEGPDVCHAVIVHPPGGIADGDRLAIDVEVAAGAHALITTPGAAKWYRTPELGSAQTVRLLAGPGSVLEWIPQESIVFDQVRAHSTTEVDLEADATFIGSEVVCLGRTASGERFAAGSFRQRWRVRRAGTLIWHEAGTMHGGGRLLDSPVGLGGQPVGGTFLAVGRAIGQTLVDDLRAALQAAGLDRCCAVSRLPDLLVGRYAGASAEEARAAFVALWRVLRPELAGKPAELPRLWLT